MPEKKTDRRVKYTKMVIRESFIKALSRKPITKITVKEICEGADVNRATFYMHYSDQYDLLRKIEEEIIEDISRYLLDYSFVDIRIVPTEMIVRVLEYINDNAELFDLLLNLNGDMNFQQEVIKIIGEKHLIPLLGADLSNIKEAEYIFRFMASGAVGMIQMWLREGRKISASELASLMLRITFNKR